MFRLLFLVLLCCTPLKAAEEVVVDLSQSHVSITTDFTGSEIHIFGAVKRTEPLPQDSNLEVVVAVAGPSEPVVVRKKEKRFGIWVNTESVEVDAAPSFYAVASSTDFDQAMSAVEDQRHRVSINQAIRSVGAPYAIQNPGEFAEAVVRIQENNGNYSEQPGQLRLLDETLFRTKIALPANLVEGDYIARIFLTRDRKVVDQFETSIAVRKVGLERWIYNLAHEKPLIYGLLSLAIAIAAGWLASSIFRFLRF